MITTTQSTYQNKHFEDVLWFFDKSEVLKQIYKKTKGEPLNILFTGATGAGKSSTINALFDTEVAKVGTTPNPETQFIEKYELDKLIIWDTPGLGDSPENDSKYAKAIKDKLTETDSKGDLLIDLVVVILDAGSRNMGTEYQLINNVIIPNLGENKNRILVALNKADKAMEPEDWNRERNCPEEELVKFLEEQCQSVHQRIKDATGVNVQPFYYTAGFKRVGQRQRPPYNLGKFFSLICENVPEKKRIQVIANLNRQDARENLRDNDNNDSGLWETVKSLIKPAIEAVVETVIETAPTIIIKAAKSLIKMIKFW